MKLNFIPLFIVLFSNSLLAQVIMGTSFGSYTQNFNSLGTVGTTWTNNSTIANWYAQETGTGSGITVSNGSSGANNLYNFGTTSAADRALGAVGIGPNPPGYHAWGLLLRNMLNPGITRTSITVAYTGEQWRNGGDVGETMLFYYKRSSSPITDLQVNLNTTWTAVTALNFASPTNGGTATALDGNAAANRTLKSATIVFAVPLTSSEYIMLKWEDPDFALAGVDQGMSTDDVTVSWTSLTALPLSLKAYSGYQINNQFKLEWITATESNNEFFTVETAGFDHNFKPIGKVDGAGTSQEEKHYSFMAPDPFIGINYYRLRQTDFNGTSVLSKVISFNYAPENKSNIFPNPAADRLNIKFARETGIETEFQLINNQGKILKSWNSRGDTNPMVLHIGEIPAGAYMLNLHSNQKTEMHKFIKY